MVVFDQVRNVSLQFATASFISARVVFGTKLITSLVAYADNSIQQIDFEQSRNLQDQSIQSNW